MDSLKPGDPVAVGSYRIIARLGAGGMGQVFLGASPSGRKVAVKLIHPGYASDPQFRERFISEIAAARLVGGFHTAQVVDADPPWRCWSTPHHSRYPASRRPQTAHWGQ
jgi:eukaryotic-like serine/threonine-protein kinase